MTDRMTEREVDDLLARPRMQHALIAVALRGFTVGLIIGVIVGMLIGGGAALMLLGR